MNNNSSNNNKNRGFKAIASNAVRAMNNISAPRRSEQGRTKPPVSSSSSSSHFLTQHKLLTPLDKADIEMGIGITVTKHGSSTITSSSIPSSMGNSKLTSLELETLTKRDEARREKHAADLALLAGSPVDAYERYTSAAEKTKKIHDPLWYAACLEGCASAFVAMADIGGLLADTYLDNNFQYPEDIMNLAQNYKNNNINNASGPLNGGSYPSSSNEGNSDNATTITNANKWDRHNRATMPAAIHALMEECTAITSRHHRLSSIHAELLVKMAWYMAEMEDKHLRCKWGEGCYAGENRDNNRWELTNVAQAIDLNALATYASSTSSSLSGSLQPLLGGIIVTRCRRFTEILHRAVAHGGLDSGTRSYISTLAARMCIRGVLTTSWGGVEGGRHSKQSANVRRMCMPRKGAFFATVAAESAVLCPQMDGRRKVSSWLAPSHLYSSRENGLASWKGKCGYAWATLRATVLHAMSKQVGSVTAEVATELLLMLLSEISSKNQDKFFNNHEMISMDPSRHDTDSRRVGDISMSDQYSVGGEEKIPTDNDTVTSEVTTSTTASKNVKRTNVTQTRNIFFSQASSNINPIMLAQSKWVQEDPVPMLQLPLVDASAQLFLAKNDPVAMAILTEILQYSSLPRNDDKTTTHSSNSLALLCLGSVTSRVRFEICAEAQKQCLTYLNKIRKGMPVTSTFVTPTLHLTRRNGYNGRNDAHDAIDKTTSIPVPLEILSAKIEKSESHLILNKTTMAGFASKPTTSMATFFNPYAKQKKDDVGGGGKNSGVTLVAEGEERIIEIQFGNRLSIPLVISSCCLIFDTQYKKGNKNNCVEIEAPPLSFTIPPRSEVVDVRFPFNVIATSRDLKSHNSAVGPSTNNSIFHLVGLRISCINRSFFISFDPPTPAINGTNEDKGNDMNSKKSKEKQRNVHMTMIPYSASIYPRLPSQHKDTRAGKSTIAKRSSNISVRMESVPAQPNLLVAFQTSQTPLDDSAMVPVHLSDGEIYTIPPFKLENDFGPSGLGNLERLQIVGVGMPGLSEEILFDTDELAKALEEEEDNFSDTSTDDSREISLGTEGFEEMMESDGLPPLKMKCIADGLSLKSINDKNKSLGEGSIVTFQMAATHDMGNQLLNGGNVRIRFRYRGPSPSPGVELWRKREIGLHIVRVKGPRISSLTFRSDLSWSSSYSELCHSLAQQRLQRDKISSCDNCSVDNSFNKHDHLSRQNIDTPDEGIVATYRFGKDKGIYVSGDSIVVLMAVANETTSTIILSNRHGMVGGFEGSPMRTVRVTSGVSVKIPIIIPRIERVDENGELVDIAAELILRTALQWETEVGQESEFVNRRKRQGRVRIPSRCLREIIDEHNSFLSRICKPPVNIRINIDAQNQSQDDVVYLGSSLDMQVEIDIADWVPATLISNCSITLEFCCAKKDSGRCVEYFNQENERAYIWCGQLRRTIDTNKKVIEHNARIIFLKPGVFILSACVQIRSKVSKGDETWWAPRAKVVKVEKEI